MEADPEAAIAATKTDLDELGVILPEDEKENKHSGVCGEAGAGGLLESCGGIYADMYMQAARLGIDVVGESQLVGYRRSFPASA